MAVINITGTLHVHLHTTDLSQVMSILEAIEDKVTQLSHEGDIIAATAELDRQQKSLVEAMAAASSPSPPQQP